MQQGFVYVLINPSMEGLIKIGKTIKDPSERAGELSKATGVPTPFIVVYKEIFADHSRAEVFVHTYLEQKGYRVSGNREFFNASMNDAIDAIRAAKESDIKTDNVNIITKTNSINSPKFPYEDIEKEAEDYASGTDTVFQDYKKSFQLFKKAAILVSKSAMKSLGIMYYNGYGCKKNLDKSIEQYERAIALGGKCCYCEMSYAYLEKGHNENAQKSWSNYIKFILAIEPNNKNIGRNCILYIWLMYKNKFQIKNLEFLYKYQNEIILAVLEYFKMKNQAIFFYHIADRFKNPEYFKTLVEMTDIELGNTLWRYNYFTLEEFLDFEKRAKKTLANLQCI